MAELAKIIGLHRFDCSSVVSRMRNPCKMLPKRIYVKRGVRDDDSGGRSYFIRQPFLQPVACQHFGQSYAHYFLALLRNVIVNKILKMPLFVGIECA